MEGLEAAAVHDLVDIVVILFLGDDVVLADGLADYLADGETRRERGERVLEDDLHLRTHGVELARGQVIDLLAVEEDLTGGLVGIKAEDGAAGGRLAAAGLADEAHRLAALEVEGDAVDGLDVTDGLGDHAALYGEVFLQSVDHQDILRIILDRGDGSIDELILGHAHSPSFSS